MGPRPLPPNSQCRGGSAIILERPRCAALIGAIVTEWSNAESMLSSYYGQLLFGPTLNNVPIHPGAWMAMESFDTIISFGQRRTMLLVAARRRNLFTSDEIGQLDLAIKKLQKSSDDRVIAAHGRWFICDALPDSVVWMKGLGMVDDAWVYDDVVFTGQLNRIIQRSVELQMLFYEKFTPKLRIATRAYIGHIVAAHEGEDGA